MQKEVEILLDEILHTYDVQGIHLADNASVRLEILEDLLFDQCTALGMNWPLENGQRIKDLISAALTSSYEMGFWTNEQINVPILRMLQLTILTLQQGIHLLRQENAKLKEGR